MTRRAHLIGAAIVGACLMAPGTSAFAEGTDNDGDHPGTGNDAGLQFRQSCGGSNAGEVGSVVPASEDGPPPETPTPEDSQMEASYTEYLSAQLSYVQFQQDPGTGEPFAGSAELPAAPTPTPIRGHLAVTG